MQHHYTKAAFTVLWFLTVILVARITNLTTPSSWAFVAMFAAIPPAILWHLWKAPVASMSESIRRAKH